MAGSSGGEQVWNFPAIHAAASGMESQAGIISGLHAEGKSTLARLSELWGGSASGAYVSLQQRWDTRAEETNTALLSLARSIHQAADDSERNEQVTLNQFA
ncbi:6 kDa early secretory antigenic target (plasmid) [Mycobacterium sp. THAF192]|nr:6 kDa early secretory antigenic target [Mycobacterium sp. THAF192]